MSALWQFVTKRGSTYVEEILLIGADFFFVIVVLELWSFRLYIDASSFIYIFFWLVMYCVLFELSMIGGDTLMYLYMFLVSHCLLIYIYEVIHDICLYFYVM